jgi:hypothetical protein
LNYIIQVRWICYDPALSSLPALLPENWTTRYVRILKK